MSNQVIIYALSDPRTPARIRYIGKTKNSLRIRLCGHLVEARKRVNRRGNWIRHLAKHNLVPKIWPMEICSQNNWEDREKFWIRLFKKTPGLLNATEGGQDGTFGALASRQKTIARNKLGLSPETRQKISNTLRGVKFSDARLKSYLSSPKVQKNLRDTVERNKKGLSKESIEKSRQKRTGVKYSPERMGKYLQSEKVKRNIQETIERNKKGLSRESIEKTRQKLIGVKYSPERMENYLRSEKVKRHIEETIRRNKIGLSQESRDKIANALRGRALSKEHILKIKSSPGFSVAQEKLRKCNEQRQRKLICIETGEIYPSIAHAAKNLNMSKQHLFNNIKGGWKSRGYTFKRI